MDKIAVLDFGGQYCHLIARRIRDLGVSAEVVQSDIPPEVLKSDKTVKGVILSGGARSVFAANAPRFHKEILDIKVPILGICYGHQLIAHLKGGRVAAGQNREYGLAELNIRTGGKILDGLGKVKKVWMNHGDIVIQLPKGFVSLASTESLENAAFADFKSNIWGVQFHPEVSHTEQGGRILKNFVFNICKCGKLRTSRLIAESIIKNIMESIGKKKAVIGLSGGVDSSVASALAEKAIGKQLTAIYVDTGLMRQGETEFIKRTFGRTGLPAGQAGLNLKVINAEKQFFRALKGIDSPEKKRKTIGKLFADIFSAAAKKERAGFLIQGTIYSDRIESGLTKHSSVIKSHHNVGGLPKNLKLKLCEPLKDLYKDEVRKLAREIGLPKEITERQVFPGPGLAIRIIGEVTPEKVKIVRQTGVIIEEELKGTKFWPHIWMSFPVLLPIKSVGIQGDRRSYKYPLVVRIVESRDAMTANFSKISFSILEKISTRITNEVREINRVVYDITNKPPATMEWE